MAFNISDFQTKLAKYGLSRDNLFIINITPPSNLGSVIPMSDLIFFCKSVDLPSITIETTPIQKEGWGRYEKMPTGMTPDQLQMIFMVDAGFKVKAFFHRWLQSIVNFNSSNSTQSYNGMRPHEVAYRNEYSGTVEVIVYSYNTESVNYTYQFSNAFPVSMGNITTSWENNDTIMTMPISFVYGGYTVAGFGESTQYQGNTTEFQSLGGNSVLGAVVETVVSQLPTAESLTDTVNAWTTVRGF
jgi:hypothetical protein